MIAVPKNILVIRFSSIGDIVLTFPLLGMLHHAFPQARIDYVVKSQYVDLLRYTPLIDKIYSFDKRRGLKGLMQIRREIRQNDYDLTIDLQSNFRSLLVKRMQNTRVVSYKKPLLKRLLLVKFKCNRFKTVKPVYQRYIDTLDTVLHPREAPLWFDLDFRTCQQVKSELKRRGYSSKETNIAFIPGAGRETKKWPAAYYAELASLLCQNRLVKIWIFGGKADKDIADLIHQAAEKQVVNLAGQFSLMQSACGLAMMDVVVSNDSGFMHIANALHKPLVAIFGPTTEEFGFYPIGSNAMVIENKTLYCRPCSHVGPHTCPQNHFKCMMDLHPQWVYQQILDHLPPRTREADHRDA